MPATRHGPLIESLLPALWAGAALLAACSIWMSWSEPCSPAVRRTTLDTETFLSQAAKLPDPALAFAKLYVGEVRSLSEMPQNPRARAQFASSFNLRTFEYVSDQDNWGVEDYWAAPLEMASKGSGDCEDFAFAAFEALAASGSPPGSLRMAFARINLEGHIQTHMVLLVLDGPKTWVVDNTREEVADLADRPDLGIFLSFDEKSIYVGASSMVRGRSQALLPRWRDLLNKAASEGFR